MTKEEAVWCEICKMQILPKSWSKAGWPKRPYGVGICGCRSGLPVLHNGDIIVDRNYTALKVEIGRATYGYRAENIMAIQRENQDGVWVVVWRRNAAK